ncbi:MAG: hypothetical protein ACXACI_10750 [Candidatus Hodarchaeales archaeon]|jgi:hypothetical protein
MTAGKERLTGGEMVAEYILQQEVPFTVGIPGHGCLGLVDAPQLILLTVIFASLDDLW